MNELGLLNSSSRRDIKLSMIIPHFNNAELLGVLLTSILIECNDDTQIIVVDDNSTKSLDEYIHCQKKYGDRVEFYKNNCGIKSAGTCRNIGIEHAIGKWILFCDADDYLLPGWYKTVENCFERNDDVVFFPPTAVKLYSDTPSARADRMRKLLMDYENNKVGAEIRLRVRFISPCSKLIRTEFIRNRSIEFDPTMYGNDVMFSTKLGLTITKFDVLKDEIYCITEGTGSLTKDKTRESLWIRAEVAIRRIRYIKERITHKEWLQSGLGVLPLTYVLKSIRHRYGLKYTKNIIKLFLRSGISIIPLDIFESIWFYTF